VVPALAELERAFSVAEEKLEFKLQLSRMPKPMITIQSGGRRSSAGWFCPNHWNSGDNQPISESNFCAEQLARDADEILGTLLHQMCHYANHLDGVRDMSARGRHNRRFQARCEQIGLHCERHSKAKGFARTRITRRLAWLVDAVRLEESAFQVFRQTAAPARGPSKSKKWRCGCPKNIRAAVDLNVRCLDCQEPFVLAEATGPAPSDTKPNDC
jgi:hypothetical protein